MNASDVGRFFDLLTNNYTDVIERCFPRYREMLWALLDYLPEGRRFASVLELGCGTGNLSVLLHDLLPQARFHLVDVSADSLDVCRARFPVDAEIHYDQRDFRELAFPNGSFDLIASSIAIHHLNPSEKQQLFQQCHAWLSDAGLMTFADQFAGATKDLTDRHRSNWKALTFNAGSSAEDWEMWMQHQADHDHHDTLADQMDWLKRVGFRAIDCPWRYLLWTVVQARK